MVAEGSAARRGCFRHFFALVVLLLAIPRPVPAQEPASSRDLVGQRVRISPIGTDTTIVGVVSARNSRSIQLGSGPPDARSVPLASIERLEMSLGYRSNSRVGVNYGFAIGGTLFGIYGIEFANELGGDRLVGFAFFGAVGGFVGGFVGGLIGSLSGGEHWVDVSVAPAAAGTGVGISVPLPW